MWIEEWGEVDLGVHFTIRLRICLKRPGLKYQEENGIYDMGDRYDDMYVCKVTEFYANSNFPNWIFISYVCMILTEQSVFPGEGYLPTSGSVLCSERPTDADNESKAARDTKLLQTPDRGHVQTSRITLK